MKNRLKELRKAKKLSQKEFAKAFNKFIREYKDYAVLDNNGKVKKVSQATISRWEGGKTPIPTKYYEALANFFDVPLSYIQGAGYSKEKIEKIILDEINLRLADYFIKHDQGKVENNILSLALYTFINNTKNDEYLNEYLDLCSKSVKENHEIPVLNAKLEKLLREVYDFIFKQDSILSWNKENFENREELDTFLVGLISKEMNKTLSTVGKWFTNGYYAEYIDSKEYLHIPFKELEDSLHFKMIEDLKYSKDLTKVITSLRAYQDFIKFIISEVQSTMNKLDAESKKEDKNQQ